MSTDKTKLTKAEMHVLADCVKTITGRPMTEGDFRSVIRDVGVGAMAQYEVTEALKDQRENFVASPLERLKNLVAVLPEPVMESLAAIANTYITERVNDKYSADTAVISDMQCHLTAAIQKCTDSDNRLVLANAKSDELKQALDNANINLGDQLERNRKLDLEKSLLEGRLLEREANDKRSGKKAPAAPAAPATAKLPETRTGGKRRDKTTESVTVATTDGSLPA